MVAQAQHAANAPAEERPDITDPEADRLERVYRTSDDAPHTKHRGKTTTAPFADAMRVGCICMDGTTERQTASGACAGRKGVRFWVYQRPNNDTLLQATTRHTAHPDALAPEIAIDFGQPTKQAQPPLSASEIAFYVTLALSAGGTVVTAVVAIWRQHQQTEWLWNFFTKKSIKILNTDKYALSLPQVT